MSDPVGWIIKLQTQFLGDEGRSLLEVIDVMVADPEQALARLRVQRGSRRGEQLEASEPITAEIAAALGLRPGEVRYR